MIPIAVPVVVVSIEISAELSVWHEIIPIAIHVDGRSISVIADGIVAFVLAAVHPCDGESLRLGTATCSRGLELFCAEYFQLDGLFS